jgi:hypothetical protein
VTDPDHVFLRTWLLEFFKSRHYKWHDLSRIVEHVITDGLAHDAAKRLKRNWRCDGISDVVYPVLMELKIECRIKVHNNGYRILNVLEAIAEAAND